MLYLWEYFKHMFLLKQISRQDLKAFKQHQLICSQTVSSLADNSHTVVTSLTYLFK